MLGGGASSAPLLPDAQHAQSGSGSEASHSPLPPSVSHSRLSPALKSGEATPPETEWSTAVTSALPVMLMNVLQVYTYSQLIVLQTSLDASDVVAMHLIGLVVAQLFFVALGATRYAIAGPDVTVALLCHAMAATVYASDAVPDAGKSPTALASFAVCAILQGAIYVALGILRAGELVRYLPYSVIAGMLAVTGFGCVRASLMLTSGLEDISGAMLRRRPAQLGATCAFAAANLFVASLSTNAVAFLLCVPSALLLFYGASGFNGLSAEQLLASGWLFEPCASKPLSDLWATSPLADVEWAEVVPDAVPFVSYSLVCIVALVLKTVALETVAGSAIDLNRELCISGAGALASGALGGSVANHSSSHVRAMRRAGVSNRRVGVVTLVLTTALLACGAPLMNVLPRFLLGGLLLSLGAQMSFDWLWVARRRIDRPGLCVLYSMLAAAVLTDIPTAVFVGVVAGLGLSHLRLSRLNALKYHCSARAYRPRLSRPLRVQAFLRAHSGAIHMLGLEGYLLEGTVARLQRYLLHGAWRHGAPEMRYLIVDLTMCQGADPAAIALLLRTCRLLAASSVRLLLANVEPSLAHALRSQAADSAAGRGSQQQAQHGDVESRPEELSDSQSPGLSSGPELDASPLLFGSVSAALEWAEDELLLRGSPPPLTYAQGENLRRNLRRTTSLGGAAGAAGASAARQPMSPRRANTDPSADDECRVARPYRLGAADGVLPYAHASLPASLAWAKLLPYGTVTPVRAGEALTTQGHTSKSIYITPTSGSAIEVSIDVGHTSGPLHVATLRHGGVFGAEGALLSVPSVASSRVLRSAQPTCNVLVLSGSSFTKLKAAQPELLQQLLAAACSQQQDHLHMLGRRTTLTRGGGWGGPSYDLATTPEADDETGVSLPFGFGGGARGRSPAPRASLHSRGYSPPTRR